METGFLRVKRREIFHKGGPSKREQRGAMRLKSSLPKRVRKKKAIVWENEKEEPDRIARTAQLFLKKFPEDGRGAVHADKNSGRASEECQGRGER